MPDADDLAVFPVDQWISHAVDWVALHLRPLFMAIKWPVETLLAFNDYVLHSIPFPVILVLTFLASARLAGLGVGVFSTVALLVIAAIGVWSEAMTTLSLITTAILLCIVIGIPVGIWCARSDRVWSIVRPVLDLMQTAPTFVYLVPVVMLFGVGAVSTSTKSPRCAVACTRPEISAASASPLNSPPRCRVTARSSAPSARPILSSRCSIPIST